MRKTSNQEYHQMQINWSGSNNNITYYDRDGHKTKETWEKIDQFGLKTIEYYNMDGRMIGSNRGTTSGFGFHRIEHFDKNGHKSGETRIKNKN
jgi:hypothetical protein